MNVATNRRRQLVYRIGIVLLVLAASVGAAIAVSGSSAAASLEMDQLSVSDTSETVTGNVSDVQLSTTLSYEHDVPDADRRQIKLKAGPTQDDLEMVTFRQERDPAGTASGSVDLTGSVLDVSGFTADDFDPEVASTSSQDIVVQAIIEVQRPDADPVKHIVTDTATVTITDGTQLTATIGGDGSITIETTG